MTAPTAPPPARRYGALLGRYLAPQKVPALLLAALLLAGIGLQLAVPQVLRDLHRHRDRRRRGLVARELGRAASRAWRASSSPSRSAPSS